MPVVTALRRPSSRSSTTSTRIVVEIDGRPLATCSDMLIGEFGLRTGRELDEHDLDHLVRRIGETEAIRAAGQLLSHRLMTRAELERKLVGRKLAPDIVSAALERLAVDGYIDDRRYAEQFAQSRAARGMGPLKIKKDLIARGVDRALVDEVLRAQATAPVGMEDHDHAPDQTALLTQMVLRKYRNADWSDRKSSDRAARYLASRGHGWDVIGQVLDRVREYVTRDG